MMGGGGGVVSTNQCTAFTNSETASCQHSGWTSRTLITALNRTLTQVQTLIVTQTQTLILVFRFQVLVLSWWSLTVR